MRTEKFIIKSDDNIDIQVYSWLPDVIQYAKGVIQVVHGMAEHAARYENFAEKMVSEGYAVFCNDHRGHGETAGAFVDTGFISGTNSWRSILGDINLLNKNIRQKFSDKPLILLGHSMGSFYARAYLQEFPETIDGVIFSGTAWNPALVLDFGLLVAKIQCLFKGEKNRSELLDKLSFGAFNKRYKPSVTPYDWLSRDTEVCEKYTDDDFCGWVATSSFFRELFRLIKYIQQPGLYEKVNKKMPILIFSGQDDPVGNFSKGPEKLFAFLKNKGFSNLSLTLYPKCRHEMLNELNKGEVFINILEWMGTVNSYQ